MDSASELLEIEGFSVLASHSVSNNKGPRRIVISPGNVQLPINVVVSIILALASLMGDIFLIQTPKTIFDKYLAR